MIGEYELECTEAKCPGHRKMKQPMSVGWKIGTIVKADPADPNQIRCPICKRGKMRVSKIPVFAKEVPVKGFSKLPKE